MKNLGRRHHRHTLRLEAELQDPNAHGFVQPRVVIITGLIFLIVLIVIFVEQDKNPPDPLLPDEIVIGVHKDGGDIGNNGLNGVIHDKSVESHDAPEDAASCAAVGLRHCNLCKQVVDRWRCIACEPPRGSPSPSLGGTQNHSKGGARRVESPGVLLMDIEGICRACSDLPGIQPQRNKLESASRASEDDAGSCERCISVPGEEDDPPRYLCVGYGAVAACRRQGLTECSHCIAEGVSTSPRFSCRSCSSGFNLEAGKCVMSALRRKHAEGTGSHKIMDSASLG